MITFSFLYDKDIWRGKSKKSKNKKQQERRLAITLFATWGATKLFNVDFYVAYQIMTFGHCLCTSNKKKED